MNMKLICAAVALATTMSFAAQAADAPAAGAAMAPAAAAPAAPAATEKCEVTKDGKTTTSEVAVGECAKQGGKVVAAEAPKADAPAAGAAMAPAEKK